MAYTIENTEDTIDSREIIERIEELEGELQALQDVIEEAQEAYAYHDSEDTKSTPEWRDLEEAKEALKEWLASDEAQELAALQALAKECQGYGDWAYGETLIHRSYFVSYIAELIDDCYDMPKEMNSGDWPYRHMTMDYEAAANEAEHDYITVDFNGEEYLMRV